MKKPVCRLVGENGNVFNLIGIAANTLVKAGLKDKADEMKNRALRAKSYDEVLVIIGQYVEVE